MSHTGFIHADSGLVAKVWFTVMQRLALTTVLGVVMMANRECPAAEETQSHGASSQDIEETGRLVRAARTLREKYHADPHRPTYHFVAPEGVCFPFDPQGCIFWKGKYHLFYAVQLDVGPRIQPVGELGAWGHASSVDLVHWIHHPVPLVATPEDPERQVYAGGSLINKDGVPTMIYHGVDSGTCIATAEDDDLIHWKKHPNNPVIRLPKKGDPNYGTYHVWDTCGWMKDGVYYSISGDKPNTPPKTNGDIAFLFRSYDMANWEYLHPFYKSDRRWTPEDEDCSCPDFFPLGDKHVLMFISHTQGTQYYIGRYEEDKFYPERHGKMNWAGGPVFAQDSLVDDKGRRIFWAWACESRVREAQLAAGWSGIMTLPRVLSLADDGTMLIEPAEELAMLRRNPRTQEYLVLGSDSEQTLEIARGDCLELSLEVDVQQTRQFGLKVRCSPDGVEQTVITFDPAAKTLSIDTTKSSLSKDIIQPWPHPQAAFHRNAIRDSKDVRVQTAPFELAAGERLELRVFLDRSIIEVYANGRQCVTQRIYPTRSDSQGIVLFSKGGNTIVQSCKAWDMAPANGI